MTNKGNLKDDDKLKQMLRKLHIITFSSRRMFDEVIDETLNTELTTNPRISLVLLDSLLFCYETCQYAALKKHRPITKEIFMKSLETKFGRLVKNRGVTVAFTTSERIPRPPKNVKNYSINLAVQVAKRGEFVMTVNDSDRNYMITNCGIRMIL